MDTDNTTIDLSDMPEVRTWYDEFNNRAPEEDWDDKDFIPWFNRGWELANKIRQRLPLTVDLYYHWKSFSMEDSESGCVDIPIVVPDDRLLIKRNIAAR